MRATVKWCCVHFPADKRSGEGFAFVAVAGLFGIELLLAVVAHGML